MGKVALFIPDYRGGGAEKVFVNVANELYLKGHDVDMLTISNEGVFKGDVLLGIRKKSFNTRKLITAIPKLILHLLKNEYDVIYTAMDHVNLVGFISIRFVRLFGINTRQVASVHTNISNVLSNMSTFRSLVYSKVMSFLYENIDNVFCVSSGCRNDLTKTLGLDIKSIDVIYNPVVKIEDIDIIYATVAKKENHDVINILSIGRLEEVKDYPTALKAVSKLVHEKGINIKYTILGEGSQREFLELEVENLNIKDHVCFKGFVSNPLHYLVNSDLFVLCSTYEGFGNVLVEATEANVPIISSRCMTGPIEIVNNENCFFETKNAESLYLKILEFVNSDSKIGFINGKSNRFSFENIIREYEGYIIRE
ncbi:glycosyltransferase [Vibrio vulnificus]|uniref:glycosyltransferase n=1 Tax=Vibrio vulnificus TaxID=672 RepID=UPI001A318BA2|nr:glycosyltransferase [Vibrio vulnificus]MDS1828743.1 glycosyltransferase [Vibrio vulnificus]HAS8319000.1 glycosyltransferase [Vibrio vulnificus]